MAEGLQEEDSFRKTSTGLRSPVTVIWVIFFFGIFLIAVGVGFYLFKNSNSASSGIQVISASENTAGSGVIVVDVVGKWLSRGFTRSAQIAG